MNEVSEWIQSHDDDPMVISVTDPSTRTQGLFGKKKTMYLVRASSRTALTSVSRSYKDFACLYLELVSRFRGSIIPPCPPEKFIGAASEEYITKRMHLLESFLQAIVDNPFLRNDTVFALFLNDSGMKFTKAIVPYKEEHPDQISEGMKWWRKALDASQEPEDPERVLKQIDQELDDVLKSLKVVKDTCKAYVLATVKFAECTKQLSRALQQWEHTEVSTVSVLRGILPRMDGTKAILAHELRTLGQGTESMASILESEYGAPQIELLLLDAVRYEIIQATRWKEQIVEAQLKIKQYAARAEAVKQVQVQLGTVTSNPKHQEKHVFQLSEKLQEMKRLEKDALQEMKDFGRGILVVELSRYRKQRTMRMENMTALMTRFHLRGANMIKCCWDGSGLGMQKSGSYTTTTTMLNDSNHLDDMKSTRSLGSMKQTSEMFRKSLFRNKAKEKPLNLRHVREEELQKEADTLAEKRVVAIEKDEHKVNLRALMDHSAQKKDELDLKEGEVVTAVRIDDELWYATNAQGKSGLVSGSCVRLAADVGSSNPTSPVHAKPPPPPPPPGPPPSFQPPGLMVRPPPPPIATTTTTAPVIPASRAPASTYMSSDGGEKSGGGEIPWDQHSHSEGEEETVKSPVNRDRLASEMPVIPHMPAFMVKAQTEFDTNLPPLPSNAEKMAALKAKLMASLNT